MSDQLSPEGKLRRIKMKRITGNRRLFLIFSLATMMLPVFYLLADGNELLVWIRYDAEKKSVSVSGGNIAPPAGATPGQYYEVKRGYLKQEKQWRSPLDLIKSFAVAKKGRVEFSHERHFAALDKKTCNVCHEEATGLGSGNNYPSLAPSGKLESHNAKSSGRFCARCHDGKKTMAEVAEGNPVDGKAVIFTAHGNSRDKSCSRCHAPANHGVDYTSRHGEVAENSGSSQCIECHRGSDARTSRDATQAARYREAQLALIQNPENKQAVETVLSNNFCVYCHNSDQKAWRETKRSRYGKDEYRRRGYEHDDDD